MKLIEGGRGIIVGFEDFELPENVEVVGCNATSTEHLNWVREKGIPVLDLKGETEFLQTITSTAEHTIGLILALARNYKRTLHETEERVIGERLAGKNIMIFGYGGRIGRQVKEMALAMRMMVSGGFKEELESRPDLFHFGLSIADYVTLHIPLKDNEGFFTKEMFKQMKPTAYFINTSRSGVVEKGALLWALENNEIKGAAVDFTDDPDLVAYAKTHDNLVLTPHIGGATIEDMQSTALFIENRVYEYLQSLQEMSQRKNDQ